VPSTYHHAPGRAPLEAEAEPDLDPAILAKMVDLATIVHGDAGRETDDQITLFTGSHSGASSGLGVQFAAVGHAVLERARGLGLGRELPTDWFVQSGRP
jgi:ornithine cyclodeaminase/alanine dehydrogenase-like protein (mu-crystallin family)